MGAKPEEENEVQKVEQEVNQFFVKVLGYLSTFIKAFFTTSISRAKVILFAAFIIIVLLHSLPLIWVVIIFLVLQELISICEKSVQQ